MAKLIHRIALVDDATGKHIPGDGGAVIVTDNGSRKKVALTDPDNDFASLANPVVFSGGVIKFAVEDTVLSVDLYGIAPDGQAFQLFDVDAQAQPEIHVNSQSRHHVLQFPVHIDDYPAATETDTGLDEPTGAVFLGVGPAVDVKAIDATETLDVGTDSGDSGDANGFLAAIDVGTLGVVKATLLSTGQTLGALLSVDESGAGVLVPESHVSGGKSITVTPTAGSDTVEAVVSLPYILV